MKPGETFTISLVELNKPWIGHLVDITFKGGGKIRARIISVDETGAELTVVSEKTKT